MLYVSYVMWLCYMLVILCCYSYVSYVMWLCYMLVMLCCYSYVSYVALLVRLYFISDCHAIVICLFILSVCFFFQFLFTAFFLEVRIFFLLCFVYIVYIILLD